MGGGLGNVETRELNNLHLGILKKAAASLGKTEERKEGLSKVREIAPNLWVKDARKETLAIGTKKSKAEKL